MSGTHAMRELRSCVRWGGRHVVSAGGPATRPSRPDRQAADSLPTQGTRSIHRQTNAGGSMPRKTRPRRSEGPKLYARPNTSVIWCRFTIDHRNFRRPTGEVDPEKARLSARAIWLGELERAGRTSPEKGPDLDLKELCA